MGSNLGCASHCCEDKHRIGSDFEKFEAKKQLFASDDPSTQWVVVSSNGAVVQSEQDLLATQLAVKPYTTIVAGRLEYVKGVPWLVLDGEPGFIAVQGEDAVVLQEVAEGSIIELAPAQPADKQSRSLVVVASSVESEDVEELPQELPTSASRSPAYFGLEATEAVTYADLQFEAIMTSRKGLVEEPAPVAKPVRVRRQYTFKTGSRYDGEWLRNLRDGFGKQTWKDGAVYEGQWRSNNADGLGRFVHPDGDVYMGQFKNSMADGIGSYFRKANGAIYEGQWKHDMQQGAGIECVSNGLRYEGQFKDGRKEGFGVYFWPDGSEYHGGWEANVIDGWGCYIGCDGRSYRGKWSGAVMHGTGVYSWQDGREYVGSFVLDQKEGFGVFKWADGRKYTGFWSRGKQHGPGVASLKDGSTEKGTWKQGRRAETTS